MAYMEVGEKAERQAEVAQRRRRCFETREVSWTRLTSRFFCRGRDKDDPIFSCESAENHGQIAGKHRF